MACIGTSKPDCTSWRHRDASSTSITYEADPDIVGPGIIGASIATAGLSLFLALIHAILTTWGLVERERGVKLRQWLAVLTGSS